MTSEKRQDLEKSEVKEKMKYFEKFVVCPNCRRTIVSVEALNIFDDEAIPHCCRNCDFEVTPEFLYKAKTCSKEEEPEYIEEFLVCENCGQAIGRKEALKKYLNVGHVKRCPRCGFKTASTIKKGLAVLQGQDN